MARVKNIRVFWLWLLLVQYVNVSCEEVIMDDTKCQENHYPNDFEFSNIEGVETLFDELEILNQQGGTLSRLIEWGQSVEENRVDFSGVDFETLRSYIDEDGSYNKVQLEVVDTDFDMGDDIVYNNSIEGKKCQVHNEYLLELYYLSCKWRMDDMKDVSLATSILKSVEWYMDNYAPDVALWGFTMRFGDYTNDVHATSIMGNLDRILINLHPVVEMQDCQSYYSLFCRVIDYADNTINSAAGAQNRGANWSNRVPVILAHYLLKYKFFGQTAVSQFRHHLHTGFEYDLKEMGALPDGGFWHHGAEPYCLPYGKGDYKASVALLKYFEGTPFELKAHHYAVYETQFLEKWALITVGQRYMDLSIVGGKNVAQADQSGFKARLEEDDLKNFAKSLLELSNVGRAGEISSVLSSIESGGTDNITTNRLYYNWEYMLHRRPGWYIGYKGLSRNTETSEWDLNFHLSSGCASILQRGDEYWKVRPALDWTALPGVTAEQLPYNLISNRVSSGLNSYSNGVSDTGVRTGYHNVGVYSFDLLHSNNSLGSVSAKKSAFFVNDGMIHMTADINRVSWINSSEIWTSLDTREQRGVTTCRVNGELSTVSNTGEVGVTFVLTRNSYFWHDGIGYIIMASEQEPQNVILKMVNRRGDINDILSHSQSRDYNHDIFTLAINHGINPQDASAIYFAFPGVELSEMDGILKSIDNEEEYMILCNDSKAQAMYERSTKRTYFAFRGGGVKLDNIPQTDLDDVSCSNTIESVHSCIGMWKQYIRSNKKELNYRLILSSPYRTASTGVGIKHNGKYYGVTTGENTIGDTWGDIAIEENNND